MQDEPPTPQRAPSLVQDEEREGEGRGELLRIILYCYNWDDTKGSTVAVRAI